MIEGYYNRQDILSIKRRFKLPSFTEKGNSVKRWVNHVRYADTWGLRKYVFNAGLGLQPSP